MYKPLWERNEVMDNEGEEVKRGPGRPRTRVTQFQLTYRRKMVVEHGIVEATSLEKAEELGRKWCTDNDCRYIHCRDNVLIREDE